MTSRTSWIGCGLLVAAALVFIVLAVLHFQRPAEYRFAFPANKGLTEQDAIELSKQAMILDGKRSNTMRPVLSGHKDSEGHEAFFCRRRGNSDDGWVLWWLERPDVEWEYLVGITRERDELVCLISKAK